MNNRLNSALYSGWVHHCRYQPTQHRFRYRIFQLWLDLDEIDQVNQQIIGISNHRLSPIRIKRSDYLGPHHLPLKQAVLSKMQTLAGEHAPQFKGNVFMLGQPRIFGWYFSPVNFYFLQQNNGQYSHMLAEVSNTPWNQRHYYLVDLAKPSQQPKAFHVSPFNPLDMQYYWRVAQPGTRLNLALSCHAGEKHFDASLALHKKTLTSGNLWRQLLRIPHMTLKTLLGIYWQALRLYLKGTPLHPHPDSK